MTWRKKKMRLRRQRRLLWVSAPSELGFYVSFSESVLFTASGTRKRPAVDEPKDKKDSKEKEEAWTVSDAPPFHPITILQISDVIFIHQEVQNDTAIVKIVSLSSCIHSSRFSFPRWMVDTVQWSISSLQLRPLNIWLLL